MEILTVVLSLGSILTLIVSLINFCTDVKSKKREVITKHLSVLLLLGNISMLLIVDKHYLNMSSVKFIFRILTSNRAKRNEIMKNLITWVIQTLFNRKCVLRRQL